DQNEITDKNDSEIIREGFPNKYDGKDIFDNFKLSAKVPFVKYNMGGNQYIKIYKGNSLEANIDYSIMIPTESQSKKENILYITVWCGNNDNKRSTKKLFKFGQYDLNTNILTMKTPINETFNRHEMLKILRSALPLK